VTPEIASPNKDATASEGRGVPWLITAPGAVLEGVLGVLWFVLPIWWLVRFSPPLALAVGIGLLVIAGGWAWWQRRERLHLAERRRAWRAEKALRRDQARAARASSRGLQNSLLQLSGATVRVAIAVRFLQVQHQGALPRAFKSTACS
jgi:hypothetical protein